MATPDIIAIVSLIVAAVALLVALAQLLLSYIFSKTARSKVSKAAIGSWARMNRGPFTWSFVLWPFRPVRIYYVQPVLDIDNIIDNIGKFRRLPGVILGSVIAKDHHVSGVIHAQESAKGLVIQKHQLRVLDEAGNDVSSKYKRNVKEGNKMLDQRRGRIRMRAKASWYNMMADLVIDASLLHIQQGSRSYVYADTIPSQYDAPSMPIHASDLVLCGCLLEMELVTSNNTGSRLSFEMVGKHSTLSLVYPSGSSVPVISYINLNTPDRDNFMVHTISSVSARTLVHSASGQVSIGTVVAHMSSLGFNSVEYFLKQVVNWLGNNSSWRCDPLPQASSGLPRHETFIATDTNSIWGPNARIGATTTTPFLLSLVACPAVSNAFPRRELASWESIERELCAQRAVKTIQAFCGVSISPPDMIQKMMKEHVTMDSRLPSVIQSDSYEVATNWGSERGGNRSWLTTSYSEFTWRMSHYWSESHNDLAIVGPFCGLDRVPLLSFLLPHLQAGTLAQWSTDYIARPTSGRHWSVPVHALVWLQISLLDSWLARHIEIVMDGSRVPDELCIPVDTSSALKANRSPINNIQDDGWKRIRAEFCLEYLARLRDGVPGDPTHPSPSCMTNQDPGISAWAGMSKGPAMQWAVLDAALALRAVFLALRFELLMDSSILLDLRNRDPVMSMI